MSSANRFYCQPCNIYCAKVCDWNRHINTRKHAKLTSPNITVNITESENTNKTHECNNCQRTFSNYKTRWAHSRKCTSSRITTTPPDYMTIITQLLSQNNELKNFIIEQTSEHKKDTLEIVDKIIENVKTMSTTNTVVNNTSNSNNKFNVNVFLDTECKDAMNFEDFVNGIEVSQEDIQNNGRLGFVDGISKIIMDNLNRLSVHQRPIHCTDWKREVLYIKDDNKWTKETDAKKIRDAIQVVSQKSIRTLHAWKMSNPDYKRGSSDFAMECIDMQLHSVAGEKREVYYPKVAKLVSRHVLLDKKNS
jgi:hypothetical protein